MPSPLHSPATWPAAGDDKTELATEHVAAVDVPGEDPQTARPAPVTHLSTPAYESPLRHHRRTPSTPRQVKETLHARSEYTNSEDDGTAIHRINQYVIKQEIGRGAFGAVHRAVDQYGNEYAVKEFSKARLRKRAQSNILRRPHHRPPQARRSEGLNVPMHRRNASDIHEEQEGGNALNLIREEIAIMKKLNHHNLVALLEVLDDPSEDSLYMVMEMCKKGVVMKVEVGDRADPYDPESCRTWFRDLILGIEYLHAQGIVHRDIKPDNLLLTDDDVLKVVDFGVSEMFEKASDMTTTKSAGSPAFLPPELCVTRHGPLSGKAVDIWSMGVTLYCLYYGKVPFEEHSVLDLYEAIKGNEPVVEPKEMEDHDSDFHNLMTRLLEKDPAKRIQMEELREHPWVTRRGTDPLLSAEENTADLVEPPTEEEMNRAITGNMSNLIVVMKAVRKFRGLLARKRPVLMDSVLGQGTRLVQPPLSINPDPHPPPLNHARSEDLSNRRPVEQAITTEGVHRKVRPDVMDLTSLERGDGGVVLNRSKAPLPFRTNIVEPTPDRSTFPFHNSPKNAKPPPSELSQERPAAPPPTSAPPQDINTDTSTVQSPPLYESPREGVSSPDHTGKGQAHDPLTDFLFLEIGPGHEENGGEIPPGSPPAVCESPPATDLDIYETAYHEEVERIRSRSMHAEMYLTRRVEDAAGDDEDGDGRTTPDPRRQHTMPIPAAKAAAQKVKMRARELGHHTSGRAAEKLNSATGKAAEKVDLAAGSVQAKARQMQDDSKKRQAEAVKRMALKTMMGGKHHGHGLHHHHKEGEDQGASEDSGDGTQAHTNIRE